MFKSAQTNFVSRKIDAGEGNAGTREVGSDAGEAGGVDGFKPLGSEGGHFCDFDRMVRFSYF